MASFLQNNGDIILDAVLTDYGRKLLAKGDGSFKISKFAFGDDEIDYSLFQPLTSTVYQDIDIMNTPILEAMTNNAASMKYQLLTMGVDNILFLPIIKQYTYEPYNPGEFKDGTTISYEGYVVPIDVVTSTANSIISSNALTGAIANSYMSGVLNTSPDRHLRFDQGLDSPDLNAYQSLKDVSPMLYEREYNIYVDNRFCSVGIVNSDGTMSSMQPMSVDDDNIAMYKVTEQAIGNTSFVTQITTTVTNNITATNSPIRGVKGSRLSFTIIPNLNLLYTDSMFNKYGNNLKLNPSQPSKEFKTLRMPVKIVGINTGYIFETNVLFAKVIQ